MFGVTSFFHKKLTMKGAALMGGILNYFYIPVFTILELARLSSYENVPKMAILVLNFTVAILIRFSVAWILAKITKHDTKTLEPFVLMHSIPDFGSLTLGFTISMCKNVDSPLFHDPQCDNQLGYVTLNTIILFPLMYTIGSMIHNKGYRKYSKLKFKLSYIWFHYLSATNRKDKMAKYLIFKYLNTWYVRSEIVYKDFVKNYKISVDSNDIFCLNKIGKKMDSKSICLKQVSTQPNEFIYLTVSENEGLNSDTLSRNSLKFFSKSNFTTLIEYLELIKATILKEIDNIPRQTNEYKDELRKNLEIEYVNYKNCLNNQRVPINEAYDILFFSADDERIINTLFNDFSKKYEKNIQEYIEFPKVTVSSMIKKLLNPSIICVFIGMIVGLSGMKKYLISNIHYLTNLTDVVFVTSLNLPAFVLIPCGLLATRIPAILKMTKLPISQQLISFLMCYFLFPAIGIAVVSLWRACFPYVMEESIVLRFNLFIPFCVPLGGYYIELIEETNNYYAEEFCYCFGKQYTVSIISITIFLTLFFLSVS